MESEGVRNNNLRYNIMIILVYITGIILIFQLFNLQVIKGKEYRTTSNTRLTRETTIKAARGAIKDRTGTKLVSTRMGFNVELYKTKIDTTTLNKTILNTIKILESNKDSYVNNLPFKIEPFEFSNKDVETQKKWKKNNDIKENFTAEQTFYELKERYKIEENNIKDTYKIMAVRYEIEQNGYSRIRSVTIAKDISRASAIRLTEQTADFPGISATTESIITYPFKTLASHVLGYASYITR